MNAAPAFVPLACLSCPAGAGTHEGPTHQDTTVGACHRFHCLMLLHTLGDPHTQHHQSHHTSSVALAFLISLPLLASVRPTTQFDTSYPSLGSVSFLHPLLSYYVHARAQ